MLRIAVIGAGEMARVRTRAFVSTGKVEICAVASKRLESAKRFAGELNCKTYFDDYTRLTDASPDAVLVEIPHGVQDDAVLWALDSGLHALIGGCLASTSESAVTISERAAASAIPLGWPLTSLTSTRLVAHTLRYGRRLLRTRFPIAACSPRARTICSSPAVRFLRRTRPTRRCA